MPEQIPKPDAEACARNRAPILAVLREAFADRHRVLEIGSGTGQHAVHFAAAMPWLSWRCSDLPDRLPGIEAWRGDAGLANLPAAVPLAITKAWPATLEAALQAAGDDAGTSAFDAVFTANTLHIMAWPRVVELFAGLPSATTADAVLVVYGPFLRDGEASDSNRAFDAWLRARDPESGLRELREVDALARAAGFAMHDDHALPANNRCVVWRRG